MGLKEIKQLIIKMEARKLEFATLATLLMPRI